MIEFESITCDDFRDSEEGGVSVAWKIRLKNETQEPVRKARFNSVIQTSNGTLVGSSFPSEVELNIESGGNQIIEDSIDIDRRYLNSDSSRLLKNPSP